MFSPGPALAPAGAGRSMRHAAGLAAVALLATLPSCVTTPNEFGREWAQQIATAPACTVELLDVPDSVVSTWRHMESRGFSICIPGDWQLLRRPPVTSDPFGRGTWRSRNQAMTLQWRYSRGTAVRECGAPIQAGVPRQTWYEKIGDDEVCIIHDLRSVRAYWDDGLAMVGVGRDMISVTQFLSVIRTVRLLTHWRPRGA